MKQVIPPTPEPTYEELKHKCAWLKASLREARRSCREAVKWRLLEAALLAITVTLLVLTWTGYITM